MNPCNDGTDIYVWINRIRNWSFAFISNVLSHIIIVTFFLY